MGRIADSVVARVKREVSLQRVVEGGGVTLTSSGRDLVGACPFHADQDGAVVGLVVSSVSNSWRCSAGCGGSVVDWVMRAEGVSFRHGVELLRDGFSPSSVLGPSATDTLPAAAGSELFGESFGAGMSDGELLGVVADFYRSRLLESPDALGWLEARKLAGGDCVGWFGLGLGDRSLAYRIPGRERPAGAALRERLQRLGVYRGSGHEHLNGSIVVPIRDEHGSVVELFGRRMARPDPRRRGQRVDSFLHPTPVGVFNLAALAEADEVIVCGGVIDALTLWAAGIRNVTATWTPAEGLHDELQEALLGSGVGRVIFALGGDETGTRATATAARMLAEVGVECFAVRLPDGASINDVAVASDDVEFDLERFIRTAHLLGALQVPGADLSGDQEPEVPTETAAATAVSETLTGDSADDGVPTALSNDADGSAGDLGDGEGVGVSAVAAGPDRGPVVCVDGDQLSVVLGSRRWRLRGLGRNSSFDVLKANVLVACGDVFHVDTLDLYSARARGIFISGAGAELGVEDSVIKRDLAKVLLAAESHVEAIINNVLEADKEPAAVLDAQERAAAMGLLTDPSLVGRICDDFAASGVVGETTNLLVGYLAATSRLLDRPLAVIVQSTSAAGKSQLTDAVLSFMPTEGQVRFSTMTGQSLYYLGEGDLAHKVLAIAEEEGAARASYALKLLQSEGEVSIASTGKDNASGKLTTHEYRVSGPTAIFLTTTAIDVDEELLNRCLVLSVDEAREQTRAIHVRQRQAHTLDGLKAKRRHAAVAKLHCDAQRLLEPVTVVNPFADRLGFTDSATRTRRDHIKYLTLISSITLLHQHQRTKHTTTVAGTELTYIETTLADIGLANELAHEVLGRSLDELPPQTRRLLNTIHEAVTGICEAEAMEQGDVRFSRRHVRKWASWSDFQVRTHLGRLTDLEYVIVHRGRRGQTFEYELLWEPPAGVTDLTQRRFPGLIEISELSAATSSRGPTDQFEGPSSAQRAPTEHTAATNQMAVSSGPESVTGSQNTVEVLSTTRAGGNDKNVVVVGAEVGLGVG